MKIKKIFFYFGYNFFRKIRILFKIDQKILINGQEIILPPEHLLSIYNYLYPKYDKFISKLVMNTKKNESVIDIGANVGDTLIRLINGNANLNYYCIEADDYYFNYLKKNKDLLDKNLQDRLNNIEVDKRADKDTAEKNYKDQLLNLLVYFCHYH